MALSDLGLTDRQERTYRLLLVRPDLSMEQLAGELNGDQDDVRVDLARLVQLQLARVDYSRPTHVRLPNPTTAVAQLIEVVEDELLSRQRRVRDTRLDLETLVGEAAPDHTGVERVEDLALVRERLEELSFFTRTSVDAMHPGNPLSSAARDAAEPLDQRALRRGVTMRILYEKAVLDDDANLDYLRRLHAQGAQVKLADGPVQRLLVMDRTVAVVPIDPRSSARGALIVREPGLVAGMVQLFDGAWEAASPGPWAADLYEEDEGITEEDRQILSLLATGCTDETAARQVGISVRHLRRKVARLMERLAATSRFEAGAEAARRGWI